MPISEHAQTFPKCIVTISELKGYKVGPPDMKRP